MKLSVSLSDEDVAILDAYVEKTGLPSRSAGVQRAVRMLRYPKLEDDYDPAWADWTTSGQDDWDSAAADGFNDAAR